MVRGSGTSLEWNWSLPTTNQIAEILMASYHMSWYCSAAAVICNCVEAVVLLDGKIIDLLMKYNILIRELGLHVMWSVDDLIIPALFSLDFIFDYIILRKASAIKIPKIIPA